MYKAFFILIVFLHASFTYGQDNIKKYIKENTISIITIDPDSVNFSDLEAIGNSIGNSKFVMLGEQDYGDAPTFLAKTRLIKYLHEKKGFNVLAFESDFFGLNFGWDNLTKSPENVSKFINQNIYQIWTGCNTCIPLFNNYIPNTYNTSNPLAVTGFDNQMILSYSSKYLISKMDSVLRSVNLPITKQKDYQTQILPIIDSMNFWYMRISRDSSVFSKCGRYLKEIKEQASLKLNKNDYWMAVIENLIQENLTYQTNQTDSRLSRNTRDYQMALNLKWISENKYPNEKIIVWAANYHVAKYADSTLSKKTLIAMGSFFTKDSLIRNSTYIIGFTSYDGEGGRLGSKDFTIAKPRPNSFENWIDKKYAYAFVDFKQYAKNFHGESEKFFLKGLSHNNFKNDWTKIFDGIFYIKKMYPCQKR